MFSEQSETMENHARDTPLPDVMMQNLEQFQRKWKGFRCNRFLTKFETNVTEHQDPHQKGLFVIYTYRLWNQPKSKATLETKKNCWPKHIRSQDGICSFYWSLSSHKQRNKETKQESRRWKPTYSHHLKDANLNYTVEATQFLMPGYLAASIGDAMPLASAYML